MKSAIYMMVFTVAMCAVATLLGSCSTTPDTLTVQIQRDKTDPCAFTMTKAGSPRTVRAEVIECREAAVRAN